MTCVVGLEHAGRVYLGGDACITWSPDDTTVQSTTPKVAVCGTMLIGWAGDLSACALVAHAWTPPETTGDPARYVAGSLVPSLREALREARLDVSLDLLVGLQGRLLYACSDGSAHGFGCGYGAIGSGSGPALGVLYATAGMGPRERVRVALEASAAHCSGVGPPFAVVRM